MLENVFTLPRHSERNSSLADSVGQYIMRKFGSLGLLTGTQVFHPTQFHTMVSTLVVHMKKIDSNIYTFKSTLCHLYLFIPVILV